jgi:hypothetical protein
VSSAALGELRVDGAARKRETAARLLEAAPALAFATAGLMLCGWHWDISWHRTIGRDTVWTPPHVLVYASLALAFAYAAALVLSFTFGDGRRLPAVRVLGFRGPSGAFVALWGLLLQGAAIVFDLWWHSAYGLDLQVFSPPHYAIMIGTVPTYLGSLLLLSRQLDMTRRRGRAAAVAFLSLCTATQLVGLDASYGPQAHVTIASLVSTSLGIPCVLALADALTGTSRASAWTALLYMAEVVVLMQVIPLQPGRPRFGPVYHDLTHLLPPLFPMPLIAGALLLPPLRVRFASAWGALRFGAGFAIGLACASALLAQLMAGPLGDNRFLAGHAPPSAFAESYNVAPVLGLDARGAIALVACALLSAASGWCGHRFGSWLRQVER